MPKPRRCAISRPSSEGVAQRKPSASREPGGTDASDEEDVMTSPLLPRFVRWARSERSRVLRPRSIAGAALALALAPGVASADPFPPRAERILSPGRSAAGEDSAEALVLNP